MADIPCLSDEEMLPISCCEAASEAAQAHLAACPRCRQRLEQLGAELDDLRNVCRHLEANGNPLFSPETVTGPASPSIDACGNLPAAAVAEPVPSLLGRYPIVRRLAVEGQSSVYLARHPTLDRDVVVKLSHAPVAPSAADRDRLVREARLLAELGDQPHLVRVYDLDFHDDRPFLVLEYVRGQNLQQYAARARPAPHEAARLVARLARGLARPHRQGVIHRDIKPKNVLLDEAGEPRLIDFGLALRRDAWTQEQESSGSIAGTAGFMAPEQARGEVERVDARSDLFALGGILYYLLTGKAPFTGRNVEEMLRLARTCEFDREALKSPRIPLRLTVICLRALAENPVQRYSAAEELARDLEMVVRPSVPWLLSGLASGLLLALAVGVWTWARPGELLMTSSPAQEPGPQYLLQVNGQPLGVLTRPVPLREGDRLKVRCDVPPGLRSALFWLDTEGVLEEPDGVEVTPAQPFDQLAYPGSSLAVNLKKPAASGSVLALVCAGIEKPRLEDVRAMWVEASRTAQPDGGQLPLLPRETVLILNRDKVHPLSRDRGDWGRPEREAVATVEDCLVKLRPLLRQRYEFLAGVAVGYLR